MKRNPNIVKFSGKPVTLLGKIAKVNAHAKDFTGINTDLKPVMLSQFKDKIRVITSFPSVDTEVCAMQTRRFNSEASKLPNVHIITVSNDLPFALKRFCAAEGIDNITTLSDHKDVDFGIKYGFLIEEFRLLARGVVIIDKQNIIRYVEYVPDITQEPDYEKAIEALESIT